MQIEDSIVIGALAALTAAIVYLWRQQVGLNREYGLRFQKLEADLRHHITMRCLRIRKPEERRPCIPEHCIVNPQSSDETPVPTSSHSFFPETTGDGSVVIKRAKK